MRYTVLHTLAIMAWLFTNYFDSGMAQINVGDGVMFNSIPYLINGAGNDSTMTAATANNVASARATKKYIQDSAWHYRYIPTSTTVTRPINSTTFTPSSTFPAYVSYTIQISCTASIGSAATGSVLLQYSTNGGGVWNTMQAVANSNTVSLALTLNSITLQTASLSGFIPANALVRMVSATTGTTVNTYLYGWETY